MKVIVGLMVLAMVVVLLVAVGIAARGSDNDGSTGSAEIVMEDLRFTPNRLDAKVGVPLTVRLTNRGLERHDLNFPSLHMPGLEGVESILEPSATRTIRLQFDTPGTHTFICTLPGHAAAGMTGAVFVRP
jgi:nitrite reductase (NO-forming)